MIGEFLKRHGQSADNIDAEKSIGLFLRQMREGLEGKKCSLQMVPTYLFEPDLKNIVKGERKIIIDAGGTNFRSAAGYFDENGNAVFEDMQKTYMPASDRELDCDEFYDAIAKNVRRLLPQGGDVGFCFSYPVEMGLDKDGTMGNATKELKAKGIGGTKVGRRTLEAVKKYDAADRKIVILNDTVATLLGGMASVKGRYSAFIGYIYGTGINLAYAENVSAIAKINVKSDRRMLINTECGNFDGFVQGDYDKKVSQSTENPASYLFEKMTSGKYLAKVIDECVKGAEKEGLFGSVKPAPFDLKDVTAFLNGQSSAFADKFEQADLAKAKQLAVGLIERAAKAGAVVNAAAAITSGKRGGLPVAIVAEGTTFNKLTGYKQGFVKYLTEFLAPQGIGFEIVQGEDLNMLGSLMATMA